MGRKVALGAVAGVTGVNANDIESIGSVGKALAVNTGGAVGTSVVPQVSAVDTALLDLTPSAEIVGFRVAFGAADDTEADDMLENGFIAGDDARVRQASHGQVVTEYFRSPGITRVDIVGLADVLVGSGTGQCMNVNGNATDVSGQSTKFTFSPAVTKVVITCLSSWSTNQISQVHVQGFSY
jgi:hypothetical protein